MSIEKNQQVKKRLHFRNRNRERYDLAALTKSNPELGQYVRPTKYGEDSVDFTNPIAVRLLNKALLKHYYGVKNWEFPDENLCPPIPGRADYLHYMADLLAEDNLGSIPKGDKIVCLDIGVGASCIYPIIGVVEYNWKFIGSDVNINSIEYAKNIVNANSVLKDRVVCRLQENRDHIFYGVIGKENKIDMSICNPPFHASVADAQKEARRKIRNLSGKKVKKTTLNFSGVSHELVYNGGEYEFIQRMIRESVGFSKDCFWFSTLVSKESNLKGIYKALEKVGVTSA